MNEEITAQDIIDVIRLVLMGQKDPAEIVKLVNGLIDLAPETDSNRGVDLLMSLIAEGSLKVSTVSDVGW